MKIYKHKRFLKAYKKLSSADKKKVDVALGKFLHNPHDPDLYNHPLKGDMKTLRSFSAAHDLRVIFKEERDYVIVLLLNVGSHEEVYD